MAASLDGVFRIIDRASPAMRGMERQALATDAAIHKLGLTLDELGAKKQAQQIDSQTKQLRTMGVEGENAAKRIDHSFANLDRNMTKRNGTWAKFRRGVKDILGTVTKWGMLGLKVSGVVSVVGLLAQGIGNLAGGLTALVPRFTQAFGAWRAAIPLIAGVGLAAITAKGAFGQMSQAIGGNVRAMAMLARPAKEFVRQWRETWRVRMQLNQSMQGPLFSKLDKVFQPALRRASPVLKQAFGGMSGALGDIASQAITGFTSTKGLSQFTALSQTGTAVIRNLGSSVLNLASGFATMGVAMRPLTMWISRAVKLWTQHFAATQKVNAANGTFNRRIVTVEHALKGLWRTGKDFVAVLKTLMSAATGAGNTLWGAADKSMEHWVAFHNTLSGREGLIRDFSNLTAGFRAIFGLIGKIGGGLVKMGGGSGLPKVIADLEKLGKPLSGLLNNFANNVGPALTNTLGSAVRLFHDLGTGPLPVLLKGMTGLLNVIDAIVRDSGPFQGVFTTVFSTLLISRYLVKLGILEKQWWRVATAAGAAANAEGAASSGGLWGPTARGVGGFFGRAGGRVKGLFGRGAVAEGEQMAIPGLEAGGAVAAGGLLSRFGGLAAGLGAGALGGAGRLALGVGSKFLLPLAVIQGLFGALGAGRSGSFGHQVGQTAFGGVNALSMGLLGKVGGLNNFFATPAARAAKYVSRDNTMLASQLSGVDSKNFGLSKLTAELSILEQHAEKLRGSRQQAYQQELQQIQSEIAARRQLVQQLQAQLNARSRQRATGFLGLLNQQAPGVLKKEGAVAGFHTLDQRGLTFLRSGNVNAAGRSEVERGLLANLSRNSKRDPALKPEFTRMSAAIVALEARHGNNIAVGPLGRIFHGTDAEQGSLHRRLSDMRIASGGKDTSAIDFVLDELRASKRAKTAATVAAVVTASATLAASLKKMWNPPATAVTPPSFATAPKGKAGGGRIGGAGLHDTVPVPGGMAAPGELIVNRHTESRANSLLGMFGQTLGGMVGRETRPHSAFATGGRMAGLPFPGGDMLAPGLKPGISALGRYVMKKFPGLHVSSGLRPMDKGSYHSIGEAVDLAAPMTNSGEGLMQKAGSWVAAHLAGKLLEGIHNSTLSVKNGKAVSPSFWGASTWAGHQNHIHLAAGNKVLRSIPGAFGMNGGSSSSTSPGGASTINLGAFADPGGLSGFNGIDVQSYGSGGAGGGGGGGGPATGNRALGKKLMRALWGASQWPFLDKLWTRESGWSPRAFNKKSKAQGIPQFLPMKGRPVPPGFPDNGPVNTREQIGWGLDYIHGRYGTPSAAWAHEVSHNWYAKGGRTPRFAGWFGRGGSLTAAGPTLVGVGERGRPEKVTVSPATSSSTGGRQYTFAPTLYVNGASQEDVEKALDKAMHRFADIIERQAVDGTDLS